MVAMITSPYGWLLLFVIFLGLGKGLFLLFERYPAPTVRITPRPDEDREALLKRCVVDYTPPSLTAPAVKGFIGKTPQ